jgi:hypothetical protein
MLNSRRPVLVPRLVHLHSAQMLCCVAATSKNAPSLNAGLWLGRDVALRGQAASMPSIQRESM